MADDKFMVSGWEDDTENIEEDRNPAELSQREFLKTAEDGNLEKLTTLLTEQPELIQSVDKDGYTAIHRACYNNHPKIVEFLIRQGANISAKTQFGWEPLHSCCQWNCKECAIVLLQYGASVNAVTEGGQTPLHIAASHGASYDTVQLILMHPYIKPHLRNNSNETAYDIAKRSSKYYNIFQMVDPNIDAIES